MSELHRKKILVTGKNGQLGQELQDESMKCNSCDWFFVGRDEMDLTQPQSITATLNRIQPDVIVNAAAYTAVDKAESDPETAEAVNTKAVEILAQWAEKYNTKMIHISTDYVFDGNSSEPLTEDATTHPINVYGATKRKGELVLQNSTVDYVIIRTAWVYSTYGANFVKTMLRLMNERDEISVVADQIGTPTYAKDLAEALVQIINSSDWKSGVYHYSNEGTISWYDFAKAIQEEIGSQCNVNPISSSDFPTPALRPKFSLLNTNKIQQSYNISIPNWRDSLKNMLHKLMKS